MTHLMYLAGSWYRKNELADIRDRLHNRYPRLIVTSSWLSDPDGPHDTEREMSEEEKRTIALRDLNDIHESDSIVLFSNNGETVPGGGRHFELAYAWSKDKLCIVIGKHEHIFMSLPRIHTLDSVESLEDYLDSVDLSVRFRRSFR